MNTYSTIIKAICPHTGKLLTYCGDNVQAISYSNAREILDETGRGFMIVDGQLVAEIPTLKLDNSPDWENIENFDNLN